MNFFKYTAFLEEENRHLKARVENLEARNQELVLTLISKSPVSSIDASKVSKEALKHSITVLGSEAKCICGWLTHNDDPGELQSAISAHYRQSSVPGRKSWPQVKATLEAAAALEAQRRTG